MSKLYTKCTGRSGVFRVIALILAFSMVLIPVQFPSAAAAAGDEEETLVSNYFADDFSSSTYADGVKYQWNSDAYSKEVKDGKYYISTYGCASGYYYDHSWLSAMTVDGSGNAVDQTASWSDYTVEADVTRVPTTELPKGSLAGVFVRMDPVKKTCYAFEIKNDRVILYKVWDNNGKLTYTPVKQSYSHKSAGNDTFRMKVEASGSNIKCYVDGALAIDWTDNGTDYGAALLTGTAGMRLTARGWYAIYDNFRVTMPGGAVAFSDDFSDGRYVSGTTYQWSSLEQPKPQGVTYTWTSNDMNGTDAKVVDGVYSVTTGTRYDRTRYAYLKAFSEDGTAMLPTWQDYTVEMDVQRNMITEGGNNGKADQVWLLGRVQADGSCYALMFNGEFHLYKINAGTGVYKGSTLNGTRLLNKGTPFGYLNTDWIHIYMKFSGSTIEVGYSYTAADGTEKTNAFTATDSDYTSGGIGLQVANNHGYGALTANLDNLKVTADGKVLFADTFEADDNSFDANGLVVEDIYTPEAKDAWAVENGAYTVGSGLSEKVVSIAADGVDYVGQWTNYAVETDFMLNGAASTAGVLVGASSAGRYELRLSAAKAELYLISGEQETLLKSVNTAITTGQWCFLKVETVGKAIRAYVDGTELLSVETAEAVTGAAGLLGSEAKFDNYAVYLQEASASRLYGNHLFSGSDISALASGWSFDPAAGWALVNNALVYQAEDPVVGTALMKAKYAGADYSAELTAKAAAETDRFGVLGRASTDGKNYYMLQLDLASGVKLVKSVAGTETVLAAVSKADLYEKFGITLVPNAEYVLCLEMSGSDLQGYVNGQRIFALADNALASGVAGIKSTKGVAFTELLITEPSAIPTLSIVYEDGTPVQNLTVSKGKVPDIKAMYLKVDTGDGEPELVILDTVMGISPFDENATGTVTVPVEYAGAAVDFVYTVVERPEEVAAIDKAVSDLDLSNLTEEAVDALSARYDDLTAAEKAGISDANKEKLAAAQKAIEVKKYPELEGYDVVLKDTFDTDASMDSYTSDLRYTGRYAGGNWYVENGHLYQYDTNDALCTANFNCGLVMPDKGYKVKSISVDTQVIRANGWFGVALHLGDVNNTYYQLRFSDKTSVGGGNRIQLIKTAKQLDIAYEKDPEKWIKPGQWVNLRLVFDDEGWIRCYIDDVLYLEVQDKETAGYPVVFDTGCAGLFSAESWQLFDNLTIYGEELEGYEFFDKINEDLEPGNYSDNFDDETAGEDPSHWIEYAYEDKWQVKEDGTNKVYALTGNTQSDSRTWLHGFERNLDYSADIRVTDKGYYPAVGLTARVNTRESYIRAGYDLELQKWFVKYRKLANLEEVAIYAAEQDTAVDFSKWVNVRVKIVESELELYKDNVLVLTADVSDLVTVGRFGIYAERCDIELDNVVIDQLSGQSEVQDGVLDYYQNGLVSDGMHAFIELPDGRMLMYSYGRHYVSNDGGKTFERTTEFSHWKTESTAKLHDGNYITIVKNGQVFTAYHSLDGGTTWTKAGVLPTSGSYSQPTRHLTEFQMADGTWRVFFTAGVKGGEQEDHDGACSYSEVYYSDDQGLTWTKSENDYDDVSNRKMFGETFVIQVSKDVTDQFGNVIPKGTMVHMTTYNGADCLRYTLSYDGGKTWEGDYAIPDLVSARGSFSVQEDPYEPGTYYMFASYGYGGATADGNFRPGMGLFRSYDGINWNFLCYVDRWDHVGGSGYHKMFHATNADMGIGKDYIYTSFMKGEEWGSSNPISDPHFYCFAKSELVDHPVSAEYNIDPDALTHIEAIPADAYLVNSEITGQIKLYYNDGRTELIDMAEGFITAPDMTTAGEKTVAVEYDMFKAVFTINVVSGEAPVISGVENGKSYAAGTKVTITDVDGDITSVTVNGEEAVLTDGQLTLASGKQTIVVTDAFGNETTVTVTVLRRPTVPAEKINDMISKAQAIWRAG